MFFFQRLHEINKGKCGLCGDPYDQTRQNEAGGKFANGYIVQKYYHDDEYMNVTVDVLSNIGGYFEFYLCPNDNVSAPITQDCLDKHPLTIKGFGSRYTPDTAVKHKLLLKIPDGVTCSQCVLQWKWVGGIYKLYYSLYCSIQSVNVAKKNRRGNFLILDMDF